MLFEYFIGVDVSKKWLDFALLQAGQVRCHLQVENTTAGIKQALKGLQSQWKVAVSQALFWVEHTGLYQNTLLAYLSKQQAHIWLASALHIKAGGGLQRGKSDKVDAVRIGQYAYKNQERINLWQPPREQVQELRALAALRNRLVEAKKQLQVPLQEQKSLLAKKLMRQLEQNSQASLKALEKDIAQTEARMQAVISQDEHLKHYFDLLTSRVSARLRLLRLSLPLMSSRTSNRRKLLPVTPGWRLLPISPVLVLGAKPKYHPKRIKSLNACCTWRP